MCLPKYGIQKTDDTSKNKELCIRGEITQKANGFIPWFDFYVTNILFLNIDWIQIIHFERIRDTSIKLMKGVINIIDVCAVLANNINAYLGREVCQSCKCNNPKQKFQTSNETSWFLEHFKVCLLRGHCLHSLSNLKCVYIIQ